MQHDLLRNIINFYFCTADVTEVSGKEQAEPQPSKKGRRRQ